MLGFETARLRMRPLDARDETLYCGLYTDAETMRHICPPLSPERASRTFRKVIAAPRPLTGPFLFAMLHKSDERAVGICAVVQVDVRRAHAEVGAMLQREAQGQGYASECLIGLGSIAFSALPINAIWVQYRPANAAAKRLFLGLGFVPQTDMAIIGEDSAQSICSVCRTEWGRANHNRGEKNVERHPVS